MIRIAMLASVVAGCGAPCETIEAQPTDVTMAMRYTTADGDSTAQIAGDAARMTARDAAAIERAFTDVWGADRTFDLALRDLVPDGTSHDPSGELCMPRQTHGEPVCAPLTGSVVVRQLAADCYEHESGIGACAETIDATLHVASDWQDTQFTLDGDVLRLERWVGTECDD